MANDFVPSIRPYEPRDLERVAGVYRAAVHSLAAPYYTPEQLEAWAPLKTDLARWNDRLAQVKTLVAENGPALAGFIAYELNGHIDLLFTHPDFARRGVAAQLYRCAEADLIEARVGRAFTEASLAARPFFERCGFQMEHEEEVDCRGQRLRRFVMTKTLAPAPRLAP